MGVNEVDRDIDSHDMTPVKVFLGSTFGRGYRIGRLLEPLFAHVAKSDHEHQFSVWASDADTVFIDVYRVERQGPLAPLASTCPPALRRMDQMVVSNSSYSPPSHCRADHHGSSDRGCKSFPRGEGWRSTPTRSWDGPMGDRVSTSTTLGRCGRPQIDPKRCHRGPPSLQQTPWSFDEPDHGTHQQRACRACI